MWWATGPPTPTGWRCCWVGPAGRSGGSPLPSSTARANQVAAALRDAGVRPGDRVAIMLPRVPEWWEAVLGIMKLGAVSMPGTILLTPKDIAYRMSASEARAVITDAAGAAKVDQVRARRPAWRCASWWATARAARRLAGL